MFHRMHLILIFTSMNEVHICGIRSYYFRQCTMLLDVYKQVQTLHKNKTTYHLTWNVHIWQQSRVATETYSSQSNHLTWIIFPKDYITIPIPISSAQNITTRANLQREECFVPNHDCISEIHGNYCSITTVAYLRYLTCAYGNAINIVHVFRISEFFNKFEYFLNQKI